MNISLISLRMTFFLAIISIGLLVSAFRAIEIEKLSHMHAGVTVPKDRSSIQIKQNSHCIGGIVSHWQTVPDGLELHVDGKIQTTPPSGLKGDIHFNPIGQLIGAVITITNGDSKIVVGSKGIHEIKLVLQGNIGKQKFKTAVPVQGPVELKSSGDHYTILYPTTYSFDVHAIKLPEPLLADLSAITVEPGECKTPHQLTIPMSLAHFAESIGKVTSFFRPEAP